LWWAKNCGSSMRRTPSTPEHPLRASAAEACSLRPVPVPYPPVNKLPAPPDLPSGPPLDRSIVRAVPGGGARAAGDTSGERATAENGAICLLCSLSSRGLAVARASPETSSPRGTFVHGSPADIRTSCHIALESVNARSPPCPRMTCKAPVACGSAVLCEAHREPGGNAH